MFHKTKKLHFHACTWIDINHYKSFYYQYQSCKALKIKYCKAQCQIWDSNTIVDEFTNIKRTVLIRKWSILFLNYLRKKYSMKQKFRFYNWRRVIMNLKILDFFFTMRQKLFKLDSFQSLTFKNFHQKKKENIGSNR